jgi:Arc/MetJ-type ribon-helix-helix transcriptional regulator
MAETVEVKILKEYYDEITKMIAESSQFKNVSDYVNFVLKEILSKEDSPGYSKEEEEAIRKRLEDLGYM